MTSLLRCEERGRETLRENCFFPEKFIAIPLRHFSIPLTFPQSIQPTICVLEFRGKLPTLFSTFCHLHSTICSGDSGETGGCSVAGSRLTWSVQVVLLESVLKGSMAEEHCASTYPQIQHPGHRRDHCHSLKRTWDSKDYPRLQAPSSVSPTDERRRVSDVMSPLLLCWLQLITQQRSCHEVGPRKSLLQEIMNSLWNSAKPNSKDCQNT